MVLKGLDFFKLFEPEYGTTITIPSVKLDERLWSKKSLSEPLGFYVNYWFNLVGYGLKGLDFFKLFEPEYCNTTTIPGVKLDERRRADKSLSESFGYFTLITDLTSLDMIFKMIGFL